MNTRSNRGLATFTFPTDEFRSLPFPIGTTGNGARAKIATCFVQVDDLPDGLQDWMKVNPRVPRYDKKERLKGPVARAMVDTLLEEPEKFALKNQGMYLLVDKVAFDKADGGQGRVAVTLTDDTQHGLVNGGHTYLATREARETRKLAEEAGEDVQKPWPAYVRLHIMEGVPGLDITELAEGLNRSMQVDDPSLENLGGAFEEIKKQMAGKPGETQIAYRQGDPGDIDIQLVLSCMSLFDLEHYPDRKVHPNKIFGQPKAVLRSFVEDRENQTGIFDRIVPEVHDILVLSDQIQQKAVELLGRLKVKNGAKNNRVRSPKHLNRPAHFAGGTIGGLMHLGWIYPMLAAFRANVDRTAWKKGKLQWIVDPETLLDAVVAEMAEVVKQENEDNKGKPGEVGRKEAAYRMCYSIITMELARQGHPVD